MSDEPKLIAIGEPDRMGRRIVTIQEGDETREVLTQRPLAELEALL